MLVGPLLLLYYSIIIQHHTFSFSSFVEQEPTTFHGLVQRSHAVRESVSVRACLQTVPFMYPTVPRIDVRLERERTDGEPRLPHSLVCCSAKVLRAFESSHLRAAKQVKSLRAWLLSASSSRASFCKPLVMKGTATLGKTM